MAVNEEPGGGKQGRAVADRVPIFSLLGAEVISSVGNNITNLAPLIVYVALAATPPMAVVVAAGALGGLISGPINPLYETVIQEQTPPDARVGVRGAPGAGDGWHPGRDRADRLCGRGLGLIPTIAGMGVIYVAVTLSMFVRPALRQMDIPAKR